MVVVSSTVVVINQTPSKDAKMKYSKSMDSCK